MTKLEEATAALKAKLDQVAAERGGVTIVTVRGREVRAGLGVNGYIAGKALRLAGFWCAQDNRWRALAGVDIVQLDFEISEDGTTSGA